MYKVYAIYSPKYKKIYIGQTEDLSRRLFEHNNGLLSLYTKRYIPWEIVYTEESEKPTEAQGRIDYSTFSL